MTGGKSVKHAMKHPDVVKRAPKSPGNSPEVNVVKTPETVDDTLVPVDRGWAWLILLGAVLVMSIFIGVMKASGILFVAFQQRFHANSAMTSLLSTVQNAAQSFSALFVMTLGVSVTSCRVLVFIGGVVISASYVITSMVDDIRWLLLSYGVLLGIGSACIVPTTVAILGQYFDKRRGLANSLALSGGSFGGLVFAPLLTALLETYGYRGCMLLLAAIHLHLCISAVLFRPTSFFSTKKTYDEETSKLTEDKPEKYLSKKSNNRHDCDLRKALIARKTLPDDMLSNKAEHFYRSDENVDLNNRHPSKVMSKTVDHLREVDQSLVKSVPCIPGITETSPYARRRSNTESNLQRVVKLVPRGHIIDSKYRSSSQYLGGSHLDISGYMYTNSSQHHIDKNEENEQQKGKSIDLLQMLSNIFDLRLLTNPLYLLMQLAFMLLCSGSLMCMVFVAPHATDLGIPPQGVATIVTIYSAIDLVVRILIGVLADLHWFRSSTIVGTCAVVTGLAACFLRLYNSFTTMVAFVVVLGLVSGGYFALYPVIIVDYMSVKKLKSVLGYTTLLSGSSVAAGYYGMGVLRDITGSYVASYHLSGAMNLVGGAILFLLPLVEKWQKRNLETTHRATGVEIQVD